MLQRLDRARVADWTLAAVVTVIGVAEIWIPFDSRAGDGSATASTVVVLVLGLLLTQRRTHPLAVQVLLVVTLVLGFALGDQYILFFGGLVPIGIAVFSTARHGTGRDPFYGALATAVLLLGVDLFVEELQEPGEIVFHWGVMTIVWSFGFALSLYERRTQASTQRAIAAEVAAAEQALAAVVEERTRIARELHDVIAHAVSTMVVQAGAAQQVVADDPAFVARALEHIRTTGTGALDEMRRVVTMLRDPTSDGPLSPQPGLARVPALLDDVAAAGIETTLRLEAAQPLPAGLDLAAYRIVQEALTNVRRHARATRVQVCVDRVDGEVRIEVTDDGRGATAPSTGGHGLVGMRERAALYGGTVETSSAPTGFTVRATLPVEVS
ncbi:sensor histidine kinase [Aeromicrobium terrae]|uniref:histidine kinase n=1 Tax=Aeromicrobium terrae TaxID=2498846 RepID=A0A5C8NE77_9ACTN|nr:sensor histidine kinase [Aeromicrobium terrae]TXL56607.1 sensor histidine kinase [Aeromicrobium terrae]